jgi:hypothetical protein
LNVANRFIRPALLQLPIEKQKWSMIDVLMEKGEGYQDYELGELYRQLLAAADLVYQCRTDLLLDIRNKKSAGVVAGPEKVLREMAISNLASNLHVLADLLNELFVLLVEADKAQAKGRKPLYAQMPELANLGKLIIE